MSSNPRLIAAAARKTGKGRHRRADPGGVVANRTTPTHVQAGKFLLLCALVGPAVGLLMELLLANPIFNRSRLEFIGSGLTYRESWFGAYVVGVPSALAAAGVFIWADRKFGKAHFGIALLSVMVPVAALLILALIQTPVHQKLALASYAGMPVYAAACLAAMSVCWLVARALRIVT